MNETKSWLDNHLAKITRNGRTNLALLMTAAKLTGQTVPTAEPVTFEEKVEAIGNLYLTTSAGVFLMGKLIAEVLDERPDATEVLLRKYPWLTGKWILTLELIGRGKLHPGVLNLGDPVIAAKMESLPYEQQEQILEHKQLLPVFNIETERVDHKPLQEMKRSEVMQVVREGKVLPVEEQARDCQVRKAHKANRQKRYYLNGAGDTIYFVGSPHFKLHELIAELTKLAESQKAKDLPKLQATLVGNQIK